MDKLNKLIALLRNLYNLLLKKEVNPPYCATGEMPSFLLFSWVVRDKLPTVTSTVDSSRHDAAVKCNRIQKNENSCRCETKSKNNGRGRCFSQTYRYEWQIDKLLGK